VERTIEIVVNKSSGVAEMAAQCCTKQWKDAVGQFSKRYRREACVRGHESLA